MTINKPFALCSLLIAASNCGYAVTTTLFDFTTGDNGWTNVQTSSTGSTQYSSANDPGIAATDGNGLIPTPPSERDNAGSVPLWARSPAFALTAGAGNSISFDLFGGALGGASASVNDVASSLTAATVDGGGFQGMLLRRVSDGAFILSAGKAGNGAGAENISWDEAAINGAIAGDGPGETYTLDLLDEGHGGWGWLAADSISVTTVPEPATSLMGLAALGLLARRRR
ncbi:PEP-CTERM sorting domain-containing protein [Verrucomicrobiaceae bacterium 227]